MAVLIGVAGGSGAGKSALVERLARRLAAPVIDLDSYYLDRSDVAPERRRALNYDEPAAIEVELLVQQLRELTSGRAIAKPVYSFEAHTRVGRKTVEPADVVIVEGLFTLCWDALRPLLQLKIFVDAPADVRLIRRLRRDVVERGRTIDDVITQYVETVRPMHERHIEPSRRHADVVITNEGPLGSTFEQLAATVDALLVTEGLR